MFTYSVWEHSVCKVELLPNENCLSYILYKLGTPTPFSEAQSNRRSGAVIRPAFAVDNASYSVGFPSAQLPADMMFSWTWLGKS